MNLSHFGRKGEIDGRHTDGYVPDQLRVEVSPSMAGYGGIIFTPDVSGRFMDMALTNTQASMALTSREQTIWTRLT